MNETIKKTMRGDKERNGRRMKEREERVYNRHVMINDHALNNPLSYIIMLHNII
jgi:hypothetical protein